MAAQKIADYFSASAIKRASGRGKAKRLIDFFVI